MPNYADMNVVSKLTVRDFYFDGSEKWVFCFSDGGQLSLYAQSDCCSKTWFECLPGWTESQYKEEFVGSRITAIDGRVSEYDGLPSTLPTVPEEKTQGTDETWAVKIDYCTQNGCEKKAFMVMQHTSNGYYNGWLDVYYDSASRVEQLKTGKNSQ